MCTQANDQKISKVLFFFFQQIIRKLKNHGLSNSRVPRIKNTVSQLKLNKFIQDGNLQKLKKNFTAAILLKENFISPN